MKRLAKMLDRTAELVREIGSQARDMTLDVAEALDRAAESLREGMWTRPRPDGTRECLGCRDTGITEDGWCEGEPCHCAMGTLRSMQHTPGVDRDGGR